MSHPAPHCRGAWTRVTLGRSQASWQDGGFTEYEEAKAKEEGKDEDSDEDGGDAKVTRRAPPCAFDEASLATPSLAVLSLAAVTISSDAPSLAWPC